MIGRWVAWWRWFWSMPLLSRYYVAGRWQGQAFHVATRRWRAREPKT